MPMISAQVIWTPVDLLTVHQRVHAEMQLRPRMRETLNDPESIVNLRNISAEPLLPGGMPLQGIPEGRFHKSYLGCASTVEPEEAPPDANIEKIRRYVLFQAPTYTVSGAAEFPQAADPKLHFEMMTKAAFFELVDATITIVGVAGKSWTERSVWVNKTHLVGIFFG